MNASPSVTARRTVGLSREQYLNTFQTYCDKASTPELAIRLIAAIRDRRAEMADKTGNSLDRRAVVEARQAVEEAVCPGEPGLADQEAFGILARTLHGRLGFHLTGGAPFVPKDTQLVVQNSYALMAFAESVVGARAFEATRERALQPVGLEAERPSPSRSLSSLVPAARDTSTFIG